MDSHEYKSTARRTAGRNGVASAESVEQQLTFSAPPEFHGEAGKWTPEHFLMAAAAACFVTTFVAVAEASKFEMRSLVASATGALEKVEGGFQFTRVTIRATLTITRDADHERAMKLLQKAERACIVSRSLRSPVSLEATIEVEVPLAA